MNADLIKAVYGFAIGDALGVPYEFKERDTFECSDIVGNGTHMRPAGTWSDDTSMVIATCDSIRENNGKINISDIVNKFLHWYKDEDYNCEERKFDIGSTVEDALNRTLYYGKISGGTGEYDNGNGALMRMLPLAFVEANNSEIIDISRITHDCEPSKSICLAFVKIMKYILEYKKLPPFVSKSVSLKKLKATPREKIKSTGYVVDTYYASLWCVATSSSYKEAVLKAVNLGGDTDTIAALTGAIAAILFNDVPREWIDKLRGKEVINKCLW